MDSSLLCSTCPLLLGQLPHPDWTVSQQQRGVVSPLGDFHPPYLGNHLPYVLPSCIQNSRCCVGTFGLVYRYQGCGLVVPFFGAHMCPLTHVSGHSSVQTLVALVSNGKGYPPSWNIEVYPLGSLWVSLNPFFSYDWDFVWGFVREDFPPGSFLCNVKRLIAFCAVSIRCTSSRISSIFECSADIMCTLRILFTSVSGSPQIYFLLNE